MPDAAQKAEQTIREHAMTDTDWDTTLRRLAALEAGLDANDVLYLRRLWGELRHQRYGEAA